MARVKEYTQDFAATGGASYHLSWSGDERAETLAYISLENYYSYPEKNKAIISIHAGFFKG